MQYLIEFIKVHALEKICKYKQERKVFAIFHHLIKTKITNAINHLGDNLVDNKKDISLKFYNGKYF